MNKIYSIFALMMAILIPTLNGGAESRTVKIHIDEPSRIKEIKCGDYGVDKVYTIGDDNCIEVTFGDNKDNGDIKQLNIFAVPDARLVGMTYEDGSEPKYDGAYAYGKPFTQYDEGKYVYFTGYGGSWTGFGVEDGTTLYLETKALPSKIFTFKGNPEQVSVQKYNTTLYKYEDAEPTEAGLWEFNGNAESQIRVQAKENYLISSIEYTEGEESGNVSSASMVSNKIIYTKDYTGDTSFKISTISEEDARTASFTLKMAPDADVAIQRNGKSIVLTNDAEQTIKFNPLNDEKSFKVTRKSDATRKLYEVTYTPAAEGEETPEPQKATGVTSFTFTATDGGVLEVNPEFPDVDIPVHFSFTNEGTEASITGVKVNGTALEDGAWLAENFSVKLSDKIELVQDKDDYEFKGNWISVNGTASANASFEVLDDQIEGGYKVEITSRKYEIRKVTIIAPANKYLDVKVTTEINWNMYYTPIEFNDDCVAEIEVKETATRIEFATKTGLFNYISRYVIDDATKEVVDNDNYYGTSDGRVAIEKIYDGMTLRAVVEKKRTENALVYLEDAEWDSNDIKLEANDVFEEVVALEPAEYTEVNFCKVNDKTPNDFSAETFASLVAGENTPVVYLNDVKLEMEDGVLAGIEAVKAGDVLKIYSEEKDPFTVDYTISEGINVSITHDKVNAIESPASHQVLPGTHIHITPIATMADDETEPAAAIKVTCNNENVEPDENGVFTVKVNGNSDIKVTNGTETGISEITTGEDSNSATYDLQGRRVSNSAKGLVIKDGKVQIRR